MEMDYTIIALIVSLITNIVLYLAYKSKCDEVDNTKATANYKTIQNLTAKIELDREILD